ncbi:hypothetical protein AVEN_141752-1 [Araneus ventricosus]|uniref:Uncharacterized protein n=1 Tax=Araneus ventricosus TaxID=182803 RepID=A0A4Y2Q2A4_ARAVE|nr:hypothetical protein AVEN_141752-1 [Araneus ventricosus]
MGSKKKPILQENFIQELNLEDKHNLDLEWHDRMLNSSDETTQVSVESPRFTCLCEDLDAEELDKNDIDELEKKPVKS